MPTKLEPVMIEDARIIYKNFRGLEGPYNRAGDRNFSVVLDQETAEQMLANGWNIKKRDPRDEGEEPLYTVTVAVSYKNRPPLVVMVTSRGRTNLDESLVDVLDFADMRIVDVILNPYEWAFGGKSGVKAYLKSIFVTIEEDYLELKYANVPEINAQEAIEAAPSRLAIEQGQDPNIIDAEVVDE